MIWSSAAVALHGGESSAVKPTSRRRSTRGKAHRTSSVGALAREMTETPAVLRVTDHEQGSIGRIGMRNEHSTSGYRLRDGDSGIRPEYARRRRKSSTASWRRCVAEDKRRTRGPAGGSCSRAAPAKCNSLRCGPLYEIIRTLFLAYLDLGIQLPHLKQPFLDWYAIFIYICRS